MVLGLGLGLGMGPGLGLGLGLGLEPPSGYTAMPGAACAGRPARWRGQPHWTLSWGEE